MARAALVLSGRPSRAGRSCVGEGTRRLGVVVAARPASRPAGVGDGRALILCCRGDVGGRKSARVN